MCLSEILKVLIVPILELTQPPPAATQSHKELRRFCTFSAECKVSCYVVCLSFCLHFVPFLKNIEMSRGGHCLTGAAESSFHGNSLQRISMRPAYCKCRVLLPFVPSEFSIAQLRFRKEFSFGEKLLLQLQQSTCDDKGHTAVVASDDDELSLFRTHPL